MLICPGNAEHNLLVYSQNRNQNPRDIKKKIQTGNRKRQADT